MKIIPWLVLTAGVALMIAGIVAGDAVSIMQQAVTVCLECIGIG